MWTLKRSPCKLWKRPRSPGGSSPSRGDACAWHPGLDSPPAYGGVRAAWAPALQRKSRCPGEQVLSQADLPPPPPLIQFFLQATFSCVAAASCRVASSNSLVLAASSLRCGSCSGISCRQKEWFAAPATSPGFYPPPPPLPPQLLPPSASPASAPHPGSQGQKARCPRQPRRPALRRRAATCAGSPWSTARPARRPLEPPVAYPGRRDDLICAG